MFQTWNMTNMHHGMHLAIKIVISVLNSN